MSDGTLVGVALAGGASRRMGRDKAGLRLADGRTMLEWTIERLRAVASDVVVADRGRGTAFSGSPAVADGPGRGPAAGILGAARARPGRSLLILACDLPQIPATLLAALTTVPGDVVLPRHGGRLEPLCALYRPPGLEALAAQVRSGKMAVRRLAEDPRIEVRPLDEGFLSTFGQPRELFVNLNSPADLTRIALRREEGDG